MPVDVLTGPPHWIEANLGSVASITLGGTPSTEIAGFWGGEIPWMSSGDVHLRRISDVSGRISDAGLRTSNATLVDPPAVAVALAGQGRTRGAVALTSTRLSTNQSVALLKGRNGVLDTTFLFHELDRRYEDLRARSSGGGRAGLSRRVLAAVPLRLPSPPEQRAIAAILDAADEAIRKTEQILAKLRLMKQGLLHELFTGAIDEKGGSHPHISRSGLNGPGRVAPPRGWTTTTMEEAADPAAAICYGIVQAGAFVSSGPQVLTIGDLSGDFRTGLHRTSPEIDARYARSRVRGGDVLISIKGTVGRVAVVPPWYSGNISRDLGRLRLRGSMSPQFVKQYLLSPAGQSQLKRAVVGSTRAEISIFVLKRFLLPRPQLAEQMEIADRLTAADQAIDGEMALVHKLRLVKRGLMDDLLMGRRTVGGLLTVAPVA
jgi:type I restriction enzyme S subunit